MENFRIESLEINKIGAFEHLKMDFPKKKDPEKAEIHILTGENGTGKSTILECLAEICKIPSREPNQLTSLKDKINDMFESKFGINTYPEEFSSLFTYDDYFFASTTFPKNKIGNYIQNNIVTLNGANFTMFAYSGYRRILYSKIVSIGTVTHFDSNALANSLDFDKSIDTEKFTQWIGTLKAQEALAMFEGKKDVALNYKNKVKTIEKIIEEIINEKVDFVLDSNSMHVNIIINSQRMTLNTLPDGLKSMISWIGDFIMRMTQIRWKDDLPIFERNFILFLDEIEVHLHPAWQRKILPVVQKLFKNAQIFISTHSPFVVGSVDGAWVHKLKKEGAYAVLDGEPTLSDDGKTFVQILSDTFDITSLFGEQNERKINRFKEIKNLILSNQGYDEAEFFTLADELSKESRALENLIGLEIRQINKTLGIDILATHATI
jgi:predicted ATP-binding protein involved in virulence